MIIIYSNVPSDSASFGSPSPRGEFEEGDPTNESPEGHVLVTFEALFGSFVLIPSDHWP